MKIYTKKGDSGKTYLLNGKKVSKNNLQVVAYGSVDELNSFIGQSISLIKFNNINKQLVTVQNNLFLIGSYLSDTQNKVFKNSQLKVLQKQTGILEKQIDVWQKGLPKLQNFILPGGGIEASSIHICRTVTRRVEQNLVNLTKTKKINPLILAYINRLSDYFFVLSRYLNKKANHKEKIWKI